MERRIHIFSEDLLFARMMMHELSYSNSVSCKEIIINDFSLAREGIDDVFIVDLDSGYSDDMFLSDNIIGFSAKDDFSDNKLYFRCVDFLHRPFLNSRLLNIVKKMFSERNGCYCESALDTVKTPKLVFLENESGVFFEGKRLHLSHNEYAVLFLLYENKNGAVSRDELNRVLSSGEGNMCDVYVCRLRAKIGEISNEKMIYTVRSKGYMLKCE